MTVLEMKKKAREFLFQKGNKMIAPISFFGIAWSIIVGIIALLWTHFSSIVAQIVIIFLAVIAFGLWLNALTILVNIQKYGKKIVIDSLRKNWGKVLGMDIRLTIKNVLILSVVIVVLYYSSYLMGYAKYVYLFVLFCYAWYFLRMALDWIVTSYVACYSDGMKMKEIRAEVLEVIREKKFITLIYSHYETILGILVAIMLVNVGLFIWKPAISFQDIASVITGSDVAMISQSPFLWKMIVVFLLGMISTFVLMTLLSSTLVYYEHTMYLTDKEIAQTEKKYFFMQLGLKLGLVIFLLLMIYSGRFFQSLLRRVYAKDINAMQAEMQDNLLMENVPTPAQMEVGDNTEDSGELLAE